MGVLPARKYVHIPGTHRGQKRESELLELEFGKVVSHHVLWENKGSSSLSLSSRPHEGFLT